MEDFEPTRLAEQVPALNELLTLRQALDQLLSKMEGNEKLEESLQALLNDPNKRESLACELGVQ